jgi:hypothetical protein
MSLFPPSTNADYHGAKASAWFLMFAGVMEFIPGCIHYFLPDGGAGVIAGIDLSTRGGTIVAIFAWFGALQIPFALLLFAIGWRYRTFVPLALLAIIIERGLMAYDGWFGKASLSGHHPPEHYGSPVAAVLGLVFLILALAKAPTEKSSK